MSLENLVKKNNGTKSAATLFAEEISKYPAYSDSENREISTKYKTAPVNEKRKYAALLVKHNLKLVLKIMGRFPIPESHWMDALQEATIGLISGIEKYDASREAFSTYVTWWIRASLFEYLRDKIKLVKMPLSHANKKLWLNFSKTEAKLKARGVTVTDAYIAKELGLTEAEVKEYREMAQGEGYLSLDDEQGEIIANSLPDPKYEMNNSDEIVTAIVQFRSKLSDRDKEVLDAKVLDLKPETLDTIGYRYGVSKQRIQQVEVKLNKSLRKHLTKYQSGE